MVTGKSTVTFSSSQSGLTGLAFVGSGDVSGTYNNLITGGSGTTWTLSFGFNGPTNTAATWSTLQSTLTLSGTPQTGETPFYGVMLEIDSEYMACVGISGTTVNVVRASAFNQVLSTSASHNSGATITCYNRLNISGTYPTTGPNRQWVEFVSATPHNFKAGQLYGSGDGTLPTMTCTDGSTLGSWPRLGFVFCLAYRTIHIYDLFPGNYQRGRDSRSINGLPISSNVLRLIGNHNPESRNPATIPIDAAVRAVAELQYSNVWVGVPLLCFR